MALFLMRRVPFAERDAFSAYRLMASYHAFTPRDFDMVRLRVYEARYEGTRSDAVKHARVALIGQAR